MRFRRFTSFILLAGLFHVCTALDIQTPLEQGNYTRLSGHSEMMSYLKQVASKSKRVTLSGIGKSVQGREIPALYFSLDKTFGAKRLKKPVVLIYCQQHGNEPSGKEAALIVARYLADDGRNLLKNLDLILVPQVNPDGAEMGQRRNANDMDLNRNHVILSEPESNGLHRLFLEWMPDVTLDVHEYNAIGKQWIGHGIVKDAEEMLDGVTNLNVDRGIIAFSTDVFIPGVGNLIQNDGFSFHRYIVGTPFENQRIRHSTTAINDGRQSMGIYNTLSFILEGKRYGNLINKIERRTKGQVSALIAFLKTVDKHHSEILTLVRSARQDVLESPRKDGGPAHIQMDYFPSGEQDSLLFPVFDLFTWNRVQRQLAHYEPVVRTIKSVDMPYGYVFSKGEQRLVDLLFRHRIEMHRLTSDTDVRVELYSILHITPAVDEDKPANRVDAAVQTVTQNMDRGSVVVLLNQKAANLIPLMLEPQSTWGICTERSGRNYRFDQFLREGQEYPIFRIPAPVELDMELMKKE